MNICLFSYNRGRFLKNCVESVERCAPQANLIIFDDHSDEPEALAVLADCEKKYEVIRPEQSKVESGKFGGLYNNMQTAIEYFKGDELVFFLQDDMQLVREISEEDLIDIENFFEQNPKAAFLHPAFLRGGNRERDLESTRWSDVSGCYFRHNATQSAGVNFSAIIITRIKRLRDANWTFAFKEKINDQKAKEQFGKMGFMANPVCAWLPNVPVYRGKTKTIALKIAERACKSGFYPYQIMTPEENALFKVRAHNELPIAEDFLQEATGSLPKPWIYYGLEGRAGLKLLNRLEVKVRKLFA